MTSIAEAGRTIARPLRWPFSGPLVSYYLILGAGSLLVLLGLLMVLSASSVEAYNTSGSSFSVVQRQALWVALGVPLLVAAARLPVRVWRALSYPMLLGTLALLVLALMPGVGKTVNGNRNWIDLGGELTIQPSEMAKFALVLWGADLLARKRKLLTRRRHLVIPLVPIAGALIGLVVVAGDLGTAVILLVILLALLWVAGAPLRIFGMMFIPLSALMVWLVTAESYRVARFTSFLDPFADYDDTGYQAARSTFALATGGWWGVGLGASREKWGTLPEAHTDFILAIIGEELGFVGTVPVLLLFGTLIYAGFRVAARARDPFARLAAGSATAWIAAQAFVNMGAVLGMLPVAGVPLPLVSYGGSAMIPTMVCLGMLLSFARQEPGARAALARNRGSVGRAARTLVRKDG